MEDYLLAQTSVLGAMLISPQIVGDVVTTLSPEDFTDPVGQQIFRALRELYMDGEDIDPVKVLRAMGGPEKEHRDKLLEVMDRTPTATNYQAYMEIVQEQTRMRKIQGLGARLMGASLTMDQARPLIAELNELLVDRSGVECMSMEQGIVNFYANLEHKPVYLPWGVPFLDEGLTAERGDFLILGGYPSDGKTALALSLAYEQAKTMRVGFFSLETNNDKLFNRIFSQVAQVSGSRIRRRELREEDYYRLQRKSAEIKDRKLSLIKASNMTVEDIRSFTRSRGFDVIYIDYLTLIPDPGRTDYDKATNISKGLHRLAQDNNVAVVALSQLTRRTEGDKSPPRLSNLRSSGQIEQDADVVMFVYREDPNDLRSRRVLRVAKNKEGMTGTVPLLFQGETMSFQQDVHGAPVKEVVKREPEYKQVSFVELPKYLPTPYDAAEN